MVEAGVKPRRGLRFKVFVALVLIAVLIGALWFFVLPYLFAYEKLDLVVLPGHSNPWYYWVTNSKGEVRQLTIGFKNSGTEELKVKEIWINGTLVDSADWGGYFGKTIEPEHTTTVYVAPGNLTFKKGTSYNLTVVTSRRNRFNFTLCVKDYNTKLEKVKISGCYFYYWPPDSNHKVIGIEVKDLSGTDVIIKEVFINGSSFIVSPRLWLYEFSSEGDIEISYPWKKGMTYTVTVKTVAGSRFEVNKTAEFP